jgi:hypothetical protein
MSGHDITQLPCVYCKKNVVDVGAMWDEGLAYHEHCFTLSIKNELKQYQKKVTLGTVSLAESKRMGDLDTTINLVRDAEKRKQLTPPKTTKSRTLFHSGTPTFFSSENRNKLIDDQKKCNDRVLQITPYSEQTVLTEHNYKNTLVSIGDLEKNDENK